MFAPVQKKRVSITLLLALAALVAGLVFTQNPKSQPPQSFSQEDLSRMVKPAVVRIVQHIKGNYVIPQIQLDLVNLRAAVIAAPPAQPLDEYISGSGFVINPDGGIITNSHVVSTETIRHTLLSEAIQEAYQSESQKLSPEQLRQLYKNPQQLEQFAQTAFALLKDSSQFSMQSEVVVLNPSSDKEDIEDLVKNGFRAEVLSVNDNFFEDEKDVALLHIDQSNLPTVPIAGPDSVVSGSQIFVFGFPATADFNARNPLESTFTRGIVSATKFVESKDFKVLQTDAKISQGSSGGPMFNERGEVIGIITFQTGGVLRDAGDNFAFAIPSSLAVSVLKKNGISPESGTWRENFESGLSYYANSECRKAIEKFTAAKKTSFYFNPEDYVDYYIHSCNEKIAAGTSLDTTWRIWLAHSREISALAWFVILGRIVLVGLGLWVVIELIRRLRRDERELHSLEHEWSEIKTHTDGRPAALGVELPLPEEGLRVLRHHPNEPHPHLADYVTEARHIGMSDELIIDDLKKAGWHDQEILAALKQ